MKFIKRWFSIAVRNALNDNSNKMSSSDDPIRVIDNSSAEFRDTPCLNIEVRQAIGGRIVTFRSYDRIRDRSDMRNYLIHDDLDFERELGKIITIESMRQT